VLIRFDYPLLIGALEHAVAPTPDLVVVGGRPCDVIVANMPGDVADPAAAVDRIIRQHACANVLMMTSNASADDALEIFRAGARAVLDWSSTPEDVVEALRNVAHQRLYVAPNLQAAFARSVLQSASTSWNVRMSDRERHVAKLIALGNTPTEIANVLGISVKTVDTHRANVLRKLDLRNNADLTRYAIRTRLIALGAEISENLLAHDRCNSDGELRLHSL
jgi:DNA-binding NarL/FixJ family response regulator